MAFSIIYHPIPYPKFTFCLTLVFAYRLHFNSFFLSCIFEFDLREIAEIISDLLVKRYRVKPWWRIENI